MLSVSKKSVRDHIFQGVTRSICPECRELVDAQELIRDNAVYLRKFCARHGWFESLVSSDADWYLNSLKYNKPGAVPNSFATDVERGCPHDCGLCPEHQQHTCVSLIEITTRCNLSCRICFADAGPGYDLSLEQVESMLDRLVETEDDPEIIQISGGEPTIHPQIFAIIEAVVKRGIKNVLLNTNGLRLARDTDFVHRLAQYKPLIYLQFDGLTDRSYQELRGCKLIDIKRQALDNLAEAGLYAILVPTVVKGVNDNEIGDILSFGLEHPAVLGVNYQPVTFAGRCSGPADTLDRMTLPDVLHALEEQTDGLFQVSDFRPVPCPHPTCSASTYAYVGSGEVIPIARLLNVDDYLDFVTNRSVPDLTAELQSALDALWSMASVMGTKKISDALSCCVTGNSNIPLPADAKFTKEDFFMVQIHGFMDEHTFDIKRLMKCCVHELLPDGRAVPFCAYNNLGYREQVKLEQKESR